MKCVSRPNSAVVKDIEFDIVSISAKAISHLPRIKEVPWTPLNPESKFRKHVTCRLLPVCWSSVAESEKNNFS